MLKRIWSLIIKEFLAAWRDPKSRIPPDCPADNLRQRRYNGSQKHIRRRFRRQQKL